MTEIIPMMGVQLMSLSTIRPPFIHCRNFDRSYTLLGKQLFLWKAFLKVDRNPPLWRVWCTPPEEFGDATPSTPEPVGLSTYRWCSFIGAIGLVETSYLTYVKLFGSDAFCPAGGGACGDVLDSDFSFVFGVPLPLLGFVAYGFVTWLSVQLQRNISPFGVPEATSRLVLAGTTTAMAAASGYFLYILSTQFPGAFCSYCYASALMSFTLFLVVLKDFGPQDIQKLLGVQISIASLVVASLTSSYGFPRPASSSLPRVADVDLPYYVTEITKPSDGFALALAEHLHTIGAKMYGAFWCSHCLEQKEMFGKEAAKVIDYVECFPNGFKTGTKMEKICSDAKIEGFPTWVINDQVFSGEKELLELAQISGFQHSLPSAPNVY